MASTWKRHISGADVRVAIRDDEGNYWNPGTDSFETYTPANYALYYMATTEQAYNDDFSNYFLHVPNSLLLGLMPRWVRLATPGSPNVSADFDIGIGPPIPRPSATTEDVTSAVAGLTGGPVEQEIVPPGRTFVFRPDADVGLCAERPIALQLIQSRKLFAFDFRNDLPAGGRVASIQEIVKETGTGSVQIEVAGVDRSQAKAHLTGLIVGDVRISTKVTYIGGTTAEGDAILRVVP